MNRGPTNHSNRRSNILRCVSRSGFSSARRSARSVSSVSEGRPMAGNLAFTVLPLSTTRPGFERTIVRSGVRSAKR